MNETQGPGSELETKLRELKAKRAELRAQREQRDAESALADEVASEERALRNEQAIAEAVEKHGPIGKKIAVVDTDLGVVIVKRPDPLKFRRFQDKESFSSDDVDALVRPCVVFPSLGELDSILNELPATLTRLGSAVVALAGHRSANVGKG